MPKIVPKGIYIQHTPKKGNGPVVT